ncbi:MAG: GDSL-type esterase/lipase family protein [Sneathiellaceae bacterium]
MRICFFGDSFVNGTGDDACLGWVGRVCAAARAAGHDLTAYNLGVRRDTSADIAGRWQDEARRRLPAGQDGRLVFSFGANDCAAGADGGPRLAAAPALANAERILAAARAGWPVLMVGPPPVGDGAADRRIAALSDAQAELCGRLGLPFLEVFTPLAATAAWREEAAAGDGAHPNGGGYGALAGLVAGWAAWQAWFPLSD